MNRGCSSNGRALALHARGTGFDPLHLHGCYIHQFWTCLCPSSLGRLKTGMITIPIPNGDPEIYPMGMGLNPYPFLMGSGMVLSYPYPTHRGVHGPGRVSGWPETRPDTDPGRAGSPGLAEPKNFFYSFYII